MVGGRAGLLPAPGRNCHSLRERGADAGTSNGRVQQTGDGKRRVPQDLAFEAPPGEPPEELVEGINCLRHVPRRDYRRSPASPS